MKITVAICARNPRPAAMRRTFDALSKQTLPQEEWELLLIDNGSAHPLANDWNLGWHRQSRHITELKAGVLFARLRACAEMSGELLVFVDDDNALSPDYLACAKDIAAKSPFLGCFGGSQVAEFEIPPPHFLGPYVEMLAVRRIEDVSWTNDPSQWQICPWGAGLVVRESVAKEYLRVVGSAAVLEVIGQPSHLLSRGEDDLFCWAARWLGLGSGVFPELTLVHLVPANRVSPAYFLATIEAHTFSHALLDFLLGEEKPVTPSTKHVIWQWLLALRAGLFGLQAFRAREAGRRRAQRLLTNFVRTPLDIESKNWPSQITQASGRNVSCA